MLISIFVNVLVFSFELLIFIGHLKYLEQHFHQQNIRHFILIDLKQMNDTI